MKAPASAPSGKQVQLSLKDAFGTAPKKTIFQPTTKGSAPSVAGAPPALIITDDVAPPAATKRARSAEAADAQGPSKPQPSAVRERAMEASPKVPSSPPKPPMSPKRESALFSPPSPRASKLAGTLQEVFEMPFPTEELDAVLHAARSVNHDDPLHAWAESGIVLTGPFEVLQGVAFKSDVEKWTRHRGIRDPPEAMCFAIVKYRAATATSQYSRLCLFRDDPKELPSFIVSIADDSGKLEIIGTSLAVAVALAVDGGKSTVTGGLLAHFAAGAMDKSRASRARASRVIAKTASGVGIVVPYSKKTELGYRVPMIERSRLLKMLQAVNDGKLSLKSREDLDEQLRFNDISNDECDFGLGLELGLDFLSQVDPAKQGAKTLAVHASRLLSTAYQLLGRDLFAHILACSLSRLGSGSPFGG
jgi:hypothetical protein